MSWRMVETSFVPYEQSTVFDELEGFSYLGGDTTGQSIMFTLEEPVTESAVVRIIKLSSANTLYVVGDGLEEDVELTDCGATLRLVWDAENAVWQFAIPHVSV